MYLRSEEKIKRGEKGELKVFGVVRKVGMIYYVLKVGLKVWVVISLFQVYLEIGNSPRIGEKFKFSFLDYEGGPN